MDVKPTVHRMGLPLPPPELCAPLKVGDPQQIAALRRYEKEIETKELEEREFDRDVDWCVSVSLDYSEEIMVRARSIKEAKEKARESATRDLRYARVSVDNCELADDTTP